jgi:acyl-coenzyme A thioesterase 9
MDLDALAGVIAYKHTGDSVMTVTAAVDRITLRRPLSQICDLELSGHVSFATGRSSMEVSLQVAKAPEEGKTIQEDDILMTCAFTMVYTSLSCSESTHRFVQRYPSTQQPKSL